MTQAQKQIEPACRRFEALGTLNELTVFDGHGGHAPEQAEARVREIDARMSVFRPESDIAWLNAAAGKTAVPVHAETLRLLADAKRFAVRSGGAFDVTVRPLVALWGVGGKEERVPVLREIRCARRLVNSRALVCDAKRGTAFLKKTGQAVDLGGIAKGYAADEVVRILRESGVQSALVNLGGNIAVLGDRSDRQPWRVGIQNPAARRGDYLGVLHLTGGSVVTSGVNERFFIQDGVRCHHLIDPRTGRPAQSGLLSVTVVCSRSTDADALSTALFILGVRGLPLLRAYAAEAVFAMENGQIFTTKGLAGRFVLFPASAQKGAFHA
ncbi:MAG: FAD:protein FMN transferase [Ethanoligenens sp.]